MNPARRNMLIAFAVGVFGWFLRPLLGFAKSSKTLSELISIRPYAPDKSPIQYVAVHRRSGMQLLWLDVDVASVNTRPTAAAYDYFAREGLYGFQPDDAKQFRDYLIPFRVCNHSNRFRFDMNDPHDLKRFYELDLVFDMPATVYQEWFRLCRTIANFPQQDYLTHTHALPRRAWIEAQFRNPQGETYA